MKRISESYSLVLLLVVVAALAWGCGSPSIEDITADGQEAFIAEDYPAARALFLQALTMDPTDRDLLYFVGLSYKRDFVLDSALFYFKRADILFPEDRELNKKIYDVAIPLEEWRDAIHAINVMARTGDGFEQYFGKLGELWARDEYPINALYWTRKELEVRPEQRDLYLIVASHAYVCDSTELAIAILDSALARFGDNPRFSSNKAIYHADLGEFDTAETLMRAVYASDTSRMEYKLNLANILASMKATKKKGEALLLLQDLQLLVNPELRLDTVITRLESELSDAGE